MHYTQTLNIMKYENKICREKYPFEIHCCGFLMSEIQRPIIIIYFSILLTLHSLHFYSYRR